MPIKNKTMKNTFILILLIIVTSLKAQTPRSVENLIAAERYDDAIDTLQLIKKKDPKNQYVYFELGEAVLQSFRTDSFSNTKENAILKAVGFFNEGVKADSLNSLNYVGLGIVQLFHDGNTSEADKYFNKALSLIPSKNKKVKDIHIKTLIKIATAELYSPNPRIDKSKEYIARLKEIDPKSSDVYIAEGDILLHNTSNAGEAISSYEKALSFANNPLTNVRIGRVYLSARMNNDAQKHFEDAIKEDSMFAPAYKGLGDLYYRTGQNDLARNNYAKFLRLAGNNIPAKVSYTKALFWAKAYDDALKMALEVTKVDTSKAYLYRIAAYSAFSKEPPDIEIARSNMDKLFSKASKDQLIPEDYLYYGRILLVQHKDSAETKKGVDMLENAYLADTTNVNLIGEILKSAYYYKVYPVAAKYLNALIQHGKDTPNNYSFLGKVYYQMKDYANADNAFQNVIKRDSANVEAYLWRGYIASAQDSGMKKGLARPYFEKLAAIAAGDTQKYRKDLLEAYNYLSSYYMENGNNADLDKSANYLQKLMELSSNDRDMQLRCLYSLAYINAKQKRYQRSKEYYLKILQMVPNDPAATKGLNFVNKSMKAPAGK
jgi:tetratricopeptide (TPR) repeat protein